MRRNCMDFSDQEHYAIRLLQGDDGAPTPLGRQLSGRYREIMVDEYQDTNEVQNCIFRAISREMCIRDRRMVSGSMGRAA